jgi:hypothetical protein
MVEASIPDDSSSSSGSSSSASTLVIPCVGPSPYKASFFRQFQVLFKRSYAAFVKDPLVLRVRFIQNIGFGLAIGVAYGTQELNQDGVQNVNPLSFSILCYFFFLLLNTQILYVD